MVGAYSLYAGVIAVCRIAECRTQGLSAATNINTIDPILLLSTAPHETVSIRRSGGLANGKPVQWTRHCRTQYSGRTHGVWILLKSSGTLIRKWRHVRVLHA